MFWIYIAIQSLQSSELNLVIQTDTNKSSLVWVWTHFTRPKFYSRNPDRYTPRASARLYVRAADIRPLAGAGRMRWYQRGEGIDWPSRVM